LWKAEKQGGEAVQRVIDEITRIVGGDFTRALQGAGSTGITSFQSIHDQIVTLEQQAIGRGDHGLIKAVFDLEMQMQQAAESGVTDFGFMTERILEMKDLIATPITIPISLDFPGVNFGGASREHVTGSRQDGRSFEEFLPDFLSRNPGDEERAWDAFRSGQTGVNNFHTGGWIGELPRAHRGLWMDEVPLIGQAGERMLSRAEVATMGGRASVDRAARGSSSSRIHVTHVHVHINGREAAEAIVPELPGVLRRHGVRL
jgi:hypothetical protein